MNTKKLFQNIIYIIAGSVIAIALSYVVSAAGFNDAPSNPPAGNTATPLNVGSDNQIKQGGLGITTFVARSNAELDGKTYFGGILHADPANADATIHFGGTDPKSIVRSVALVLTGGFHNSGTLASATLSNNNLSPVCADTNGDLILCAAADMCSNLSGPQTTVPDGYVRNGDGTCTIKPRRFYSVLSNDNTEEFFSNDVVDSKIVYHQDQKKGWPLVAIFGLTNDFPNGWQIAEIPNTKSTSFGPGNVTDLSQSDSYTTLFAPADPGSYNIKISSQGKLGIKGKFASDANFIGVDFYMRIHDNSTNNDQWIRLDNNTTKDSDGDQPHEPYPVAGKTTTDFGDFFDGSSSQINPFFGINFGGSGDKYGYVPFSFNFQQTVPLTNQDTVHVYAFVYGFSSTGGNGYGNTGLLDQIGSTVGSFTTGTLHSSPNNFNYSIESPYQGTIFDITETPTQ